ncbi:DUF4290 domain-containing protein [Prolixibacter denitrificans]|uniref:Uncharacterized protein DUF4290 n=1 Tax=Prolixibacter denitrificans TaxID=1541063 RepID=A0A2P8CJT9_9BACT|nr:DUF4290 domain-containing protein [Prolixibacter denitrificans]PSK85213.1 uncharacterized protein DUF4290 [Prolixibacter denitrificans]GET19835.1 hypothetical protein JCM18694_00810 [Prolixibacter denitrificans]
MDYNSNRKKLKLPEYGRNIHKMVDYVVSIEDREERNRAANQIIEIMGNMYPYLRDVSDFRHKLWDHIAIMSDFKLDIDYPYDPPRPETFLEKPKPVPYTNAPIKYRHYGKLIEKMIEQAAQYDDDSPEKKQLTQMLANQMKKSFVVWNKETVNDDKILKDLEELSEGDLKTEEISRLADTRDILKGGGSSNKKKSKGANRKHK